VRLDARLARAGRRVAALVSRPRHHLNLPQKFGPSPLAVNARR
jgi:hypothetical protein